MKRLPFLLGLTFIVLTTRRVAHFAGGDFNAWVLAVALTVAVFVAAYLADYKRARWRALAVLFVLIIIDGLFNLGETLRWSVETGRWDFSLDIGLPFGLPLFRFADPVYGLFPTVGAVLMGVLARAAEQAIAKKGWGTILTEFLIGRNDAGTVPERSAAKKIEPEQLPEWLPSVPDTKEDLRTMVRTGQLSDEITSTQLTPFLPVGERATRKWLHYARNGED